MTVTIKNIIPRKAAEAVAFNQYVSTSAKTVIDKFTATNTTGVAATLTVYLVASGGSAAASNCVVNNKSIDPGATYTFPELVGQVLESGDNITTLSGTASALTISASGRVIT